MAATRLHRVAVCPAGFCPSCSSLVFFVSLLWFAIDASQSRCCSFFPSSRFTFYFSSLPPSPAFIGLPVPSSSSLVSLLPPAGPNRSKLQDMLANLRDAEDLPSMQPAVTPPSRSSVPRLNEHEVGRPDDGSPPSVSAQRSCVSDVNVQTFPVSVLQRQ